MSPRHMHRIALAAILLAPLAAFGADRLFVYNQTTATDFVGVYLAPQGTKTWGPNQALNDKDHSLDTGERLALTGLAHGRFDMKLVDRKGHSCVLPGVDLSHDSSVEIRDDDLARCH